MGDAELEHPNVARMFNYYLGGAQNFEIDRLAADQAARAFPLIRAGARINRAFLGRAVRFLCEQGIDQFLDLGSGIPSAGNVHEIAHQINPDAKVAYVDNEPVAAHASRDLIDEQGCADRVTMTQLDIRKPTEVLASPTVAELLEFSRPVGVIAVAIMHFVSDADDPGAVLAGYRDACAPGSYLVLSHASQTTLTDEQLNEFLDAIARTPTPAIWRSPDEIRPMFDGYSLVDPGLVLLPKWRPDRPVDDAKANEANIFGAVGILDQDRS
ncbi:MAG: SAM-dependent methyltransferase, partial [Mycobacterium sp.]|nr:SAM-dependent methyltransferase [Mycobacterium sp.]